MTTPYLFDGPNEHGLMKEIFDLSEGHNHDGANSRKVENSTLKAGVQGFLVTTCTVALATIEATDIVLASVIAFATTAYVTKVVISAGVGFVVTVNQDPGNATISYAVFKAT